MNEIMVIVFVAAVVVVLVSGALDRRSQRLAWRRIAEQRRELNRQRTSYVRAGAGRE